MDESPNGTRCPVGIRNDAAIKGLHEDVRTLAVRSDRHEDRLTQIEITVASLTTRVAMWAAFAVTIATIVTQIAMKFLP